MSKPSPSLLSQVTQSGAQIVDFHFVDILGQLHHKSIPASNLEAVLQYGEGIDGSSIAGFQAIHESDMLLFPDKHAAHFLDPFTAIPTYVVLCSVKTPDGDDYEKDSRTIAQRAERYLVKTGIAEKSFWGPEAEFFILNHLSFDQGAHFAHYLVDSEEGIWNSGKNGQPNLGHRPGFKKGYFPSPPIDSLHDIRSDMMLTLNRVGVQTEAHHHEVASGGQSEISIQYDSLLRMADKTVLYKYIVKNVARRHGRTATFMPKILFGDNGSGMHTHISLWQGGTPLFYEQGRYADLSEAAEYFIGGILRHTPALLAFVAPTTNSYKRLVPGFEAPINLVYSQRNRSAAIRIPMCSTPAAKRIEFRVPDPSCNPYLAFSAILLAGIDGIQNKIKPPAPIDKNTYELPATDRLHLATLPRSLERALELVDQDSTFLRKGGVFSKDFIQSYLALKWLEVHEVGCRPHPQEFALYSHI
ncbi:MAG: type I glutamate--ammonia ligase [Nanoarchaeota archaeon]|nr:type I glutamate--ammonia ligase [Nanoarchaeota archaeon]